MDSMYPSIGPEYEKPGLFERLPSQRKRLLGFDPHSLVQLGKLDLIRIIDVTRPGQRHSIKLVHIPSLIAYIERLEDTARAKRLAEIQHNYAHHHLESQEGRSAQGPQSAKTLVRELAS